MKELFKEVEKRWTKGFNLHDDEEMKQLHNDVEWLIEEAETLKKIKRIMGLSHADSFNKVDAINEIIDILEYW